MYESEEAYQILNYHFNSSNFRSRSKYYIGSNEYRQTPFDKYISHDWDISLQVDGLKKAVFSNRSFSCNQMSFNNLNKLLTNSYLVKDGKSFFTPSAGNLLPIDMYILIRNVEGVKDGAYYYHKNNNKLIFIREYSSINFIVEVNKFVLNANCLAILVANMEEITKKYRSRAYRYALLECGHIGQNMYISSINLQLNCCAIGGFYDELVITYLSLNEKELPLYMLAIGSA